MSWSYSGNPSASALDAVRFQIGDTIEKDPLLQNEEINAILEEQSNVLLASIECCERILAILARKVDYEIGPQKLKASQRFDQYEKLIRRLQRKGKDYYALPTGADPHAKPHFEVGMFDNGEVSPWTHNLKNY